MKEAQELREPTEQYYAQPLEVSIPVIQWCPKTIFNIWHLPYNFNLQSQSNQCQGKPRAKIQDHRSNNSLWRDKRTDTGTLLNLLSPRFAVND